MSIQQKATYKTVYEAEIARTLNIQWEKLNVSHIYDDTN